MALSALAAAGGESRIATAADIGGGRGDWARLLDGRAERVFLLDHSPPQKAELPKWVIPLRTDLNSAWPLGDGSIDFAFALEVIEHVENPRHFFRELARVMTPGGHAFVSTPNNHSLASKLKFLVRDQHRLFQAPSYPAHITPLLACDFERIAVEVALSLRRQFWSNHDTIPLLHWHIPFGGRLFSDSLRVLLQKPPTSRSAGDLANSAMSRSRSFV
jgi:SAM-dependent methyltransferase